MTRQRWLLYGFAGLVLVAIAAAYAVQRRRAFQAAHPEWLDPQQPPEGVAAQMTTLTDAETRAVYGVPHMTAGCTMHTARRDLMRTYPETLGHCKDSLIQLDFAAGGEWR